jgi:hypothetical protein
MVSMRERKLSKDSFRFLFNVSAHHCVIMIVRFPPGDFNRFGGKMKTRKYTELEVKLTAILYATRAEVVQHVQEAGKLPAKMPLGGLPTAMNVLLRRRGLSTPLTSDEALVLEAIKAGKLLPAGGVILVEERFLVYSVEAGQRIEIYPGPRDMDQE